MPATDLQQQIALARQEIAFWQEFAGRCVSPLAHEEEIRVDRLLANAEQRLQTLLKQQSADKKAAAFALVRKAGCSGCAPGSNKG